MNNFIVKINRREILESIENAAKKEDIQKINVGDTVKLGV